MTKLGTLTVGRKNEITIMGILNISPESFYKNSIKSTKSQIIKHVKQLEANGANIIDIGGMSTAPYLKTIVSEKVETERITKTIKIIQNSSNLPISVDTCRASVAKNAHQKCMQGHRLDDCLGPCVPAQIDTDTFRDGFALCLHKIQSLAGDWYSVKTSDADVQFATRVFWA